MTTLKIWLFTFFLVFSHTKILATETFTDAEIVSISAHGPWPPKQTVDPSNFLSGNTAAIAFGKTLFFDKSLSGNGEFSCASCHQADKFFTDGLAVSIQAKDKKALFRNTPSVVNLANQRWFGWGGESDSLWSHAILPLLAENEMGATAEMIKNLIIKNKTYKETYQALVNRPANKDSAEIVLVNIAKALAAYQESLVTPPTEFDKFRTALINNDIAAQQNYSNAAKRGLKIFVGEARCNFCHFGPNFSSGEFADIGIPFFIEGGVDAGRYTGIQQVKSNPFNLLSEYNDAANKNTTWWTSQVSLLHKNWGEFKVPSLRNIQNTAPYMHNGSINTLADVVLHYDQINEERLHADGERILRPLGLSQQQRDDLLAFLKTL